MGKISLYIDDALWKMIKEEVLEKYGTLRKLSSEVESLLRSSLVEEDVQLAFKKLGIEAGGTLASEELKRSRPKARGPLSEELIREMRGRRVVETVSR